MATSAEKQAAELLRQSQLLSELSRTITESVDINDIYERFGGQVRKLIPADRTDIVTVSRRRSEMTVEYTFGVEIEIEGSKRGFTRPLEGSMVQEVIELPSAIHLSGSTKEEFAKDFPRGAPTFDPGFRSVILAPLRVRGRPIGMISFMSKDLDAHSDDHMWLADRIARQIAGAISNAYLYAELTRTRDELDRRAEELARSNGELEQFAYVASHDLQEPLRMVASFLQLLEKRHGHKLDDDAREYIDFAVDGSTRMQTLINDLLEYSRVGTQGKPLVPVDVSDVVEQALSNLSHAVAETQAKITCDEMPKVTGDDVQLVQLFQNLIGNALKFSEKEKPKVHIAAERHGAFWRIRVEDNGIGVEARHLDRIFEIFQRLHTRSEYPGTGIGLAICKKIVERHEGEISVESEPDEGSTFYFTLRAAADKEVEQ